jgi:CDGSH-type Zn-finger protein/uncharacterized Fe-S cluster protein YjdI
VTSKPDMSREQLLHALYEAAELEHNLMCTYLYAAFSLKSGVDEGLSEHEAELLARWRREILAVAVDEMSHLVAVWNVTSALGGTPRFGRTNFPLDPGYLPASVVVRLAPFSENVLQHFIFLERPLGSEEPDGEGFAPERLFVRGTVGERLTPMGLEYSTVGEFYGALSGGLRAMAARIGEAATFCGEPALQLSSVEVDLAGARRVTCLKSALAAFDAIVQQGEGASEDLSDSHYSRFRAIRAELRDLKAANSGFAPSHAAANNPVLRRPPRPEGRVWIESEAAIAVVDLANAVYGLMLRLLGYAFSVPSPHPDKALAVDLAIGLMRAVTHLGEQAARMPAGPSNPNCNAGMSFTTLRDASPLPPGAAGRRFIVERSAELAAAAAALPIADNPRLVASERLIAQLADKAARQFDSSNAPPAAPLPPVAPALTSPTAAVTSATAGVESVEGQALTLHFEAKRCIHARFCVTGAPTVFLANVQGPWIHPDTIDVERLVAIAHECPSGAIRYQRKDDRPDESAPPVNLLAIRENGPYAVRGLLRLDGQASGFRATLCRCGASKNKPFCDGSHHEIGFVASGEPASGASDILPVRDGPLAIDPEADGPLRVRGNLEITSGTGRVAARLTSARLCRCGGSQTKPFCDGTHTKNGFRS